MSEDCSCASCTSACSNKPGWFLPGEAEKVAEYKGVSLEVLFKTSLGVDWWDGSGNDVFVLAPAISGMDEGSEYPGDPRGVCVFLKDGRCDIHSVKPFECRTYMHTDEDAEVYARHKTVMEAWRDKQEQIRALLGRDPVSSEYLGIGWPS